MERGENVQESRPILPYLAWSWPLSSQSGCSTFSTSDMGPDSDDADSAKVTVFQCSMVALERA